MRKRNLGRIVLHASGVACVALASALPAAASAGQCPTEVVGYWPLDGDGTEAVHSLPGAAVGSVGYAPGRVGEAIS